MKVAQLKICFMVFYLMFCNELLGQDSTVSAYLASLPLAAEEIEIHNNIRYDTAIDFQLSDFHFL
jgi:hypothetical protein